MYLHQWFLTLFVKALPQVAPSFRAADSTKHLGLMESKLRACFADFYANVEMERAALFVSSLENRRP